jgi:hypothetical protein
MDFDFKELIIEAVESSDMAEKRARQERALFVNLKKPYFS